MDELEELKRLLEYEKKKTKELQERLKFQNKQLEAKDHHIQELENKINEYELLNTPKHELRQEYIMHISILCDLLIDKVKNVDFTQPFDTIEVPSSKLDKIFEIHQKKKKKEALNHIQEHTDELIETIQTLHGSQKEKNFIKLSNEVFSSLIEKLKKEKKRSKTVEILDDLIFRLKSD